MALSHSPVSLNPGAVEGSVGVIVGSTVALVISISAKSGIPTEFIIPSRVDDASAVCIGATIAYIAESEGHSLPCEATSRGDNLSCDHVIITD